MLCVGCILAIRIKFMMLRFRPHGPVDRDVLAERRHLPFQVLDASAIEGIRGLAGESSSIYSCIQIYQALTPLPPPSVSQRGRRTWASVLCGILRGATVPRPRAVLSPIRARRCGCGGLGVPLSRWLHLPSEAQAHKPPPAQAQKPPPPLYDVAIPPPWARGQGCIGREKGGGARQRKP